MSIVTSMLDKLGIIGAIGPKATSLAPKLHLQFSQILSKNFHQGREWPSTGRSEEFQREAIARRAFNEVQGRLPLAR